MADHVDTTQFFWINSTPNSTQVQPHGNIVVQSLPLNVPAGQGIYVSRIRCSLGFYSTDSFTLQVLVTSYANMTPLGNTSTSSENTCDEIPTVLNIYNNTSGTEANVLVRIRVSNSSDNILQIDMPDSWWVGIDIK